MRGAVSPFWHSLAGVGLVALTAAAARAAGPTPPPATAPIQAFVFDGAYQPSSAHALSFTNAGIFAHFQDPLQCKSLPKIKGGFVLLSPAQRGVFPVSALASSPALDPRVFPAPPPDPIDPAVVLNDCVALANEAAVASYISNLRSQLDALAAQFDTCFKEVKELTCQVREEIAAAEATCPQPPGVVGGLLSLPIPLIDSNIESSLLSENFCFACRYALDVMPELVADAAAALADCQAARSDAQANLQDLQQFLASHDPCLGGLLDFQINAQGAFNAAKGAEGRMDASLSRFAEYGEACGHESLAVNCDLCPDADPNDFIATAPSGAVAVRQSGRRLGQIAAGFESAARATSDRALAERYASLATRLRSFPDQRVLELTAPASEPFSQSLVAVRPADRPDDGRSSLAVVLTFVRSHGARPCLNRADRELLKSTLAAFKSTLDPGRR